ncbi:MAG: orotidine-5'-phosphate decarboxylase [Desulfobacterales bacterium]
MMNSTERIVFPLDVPSSDEALRLAGHLAGSVGLFKVGLELFIRSGPEIVRRIREQTGTGIFLDLKLHDIPETVRRAVAAAADLGVELITVHCGESGRMLEAAVAGGGGRTKILGVTVLTSISESDLRVAGVSASLDELVLRRAEAARKAGLAGVVCSGREAGRIKARCGPGFIAVTPGIRPAWEGVGTDDQQRVMTPFEAVRNGADFLVIGRPIRDAADPKAAANRISVEIQEAIESMP